MVDPLETVIAYLRSAPALDALVADRVAGEHAFAEPTLPDETPRGWPTPAKALTLRYAGADGEPDTATCGPMQRVRLETRCWGESPREAARVWGALVDACRAHQRGPVTLPDATQALLYTLWPLDAPTTETDPETRIDTLRLTLRVWVASDPLQE